MLTISSAPRVSVIVPVGARKGDPVQLYADYRAALVDRGVPHEFIFVLDGPYPVFEAGLRRLGESAEPLTVITLTRSFGEATCLMVGLEHAVGDIIVTLPPYFQILGADINRLLDALEQADIAIGYRHPRRGGRFEAMRRRVFHFLLGSITGMRFHDLGCSARAMKRVVLEETRLYGEQQRFLPVLADRQGFRVQEVQLRQSTYTAPADVYRTRAYTRALLDIFNTFFLVRFTKKPLRFFGMIGISFFALGALELLYLVFDRILLRQPLADRPALMLASLFIVLGVQVFAIGLLGELIIFTHAGGSKDYKVECVTHFPNKASQPPVGVTSAQTRVVEA
jgi:hypothetical protein